MPNQITTTGLQTKSLSDIVTDLTNAFKAIYGADINVDSDSPDGQMIHIIAQASIDNLDLLTQIYNMFDPDLAVGRTLDERCAINGITRLGGTFTMTNISVTTDRALNLPGLGVDINNPDGTGYTVADNAGNQFILAANQTIAAAGTYVFAFRSKVSGAVQTTPNTINIPVTIVLGVVSVNNPTVLTTLGINEETDAQLRIRRQKGVALSSKGYLAGLLAALDNINGVTAAFVYENVTGSTDGDGIPGHSIWVIAQGGADTDIAQAIYSKRNAGCGMKGAVVVTITQVDGSPFQVRFDRVVAENLYSQFNAHSINGVDPVDTTFIKNQIVVKLVPGVNEQVNINELAAIVRSIDPNTLITGEGFSLSGGGPFVNVLSPSAKNKQFAVLAANISITVI